MANWWDRNNTQRAPGYPVDWGEISRRQKDRTGWTCERCGGAHGPAPHVLTVRSLPRAMEPPFELHVARAAEANQVIELIGFGMALEAERLEGDEVMHGRTFAQFGRGTPALLAGFAIARPGGTARFFPAFAVVLGAATAPASAGGAGRLMVGEPSEATSVGAEPAAAAQIEAAHWKVFTAAFACAFTQTAFAAAEQFVAAYVGTGLTPVGGLLCGQRERVATDHAFRLRRAAPWRAADAWTFDAKPHGAPERGATHRRARLTPTVGLGGCQRENGAADDARSLAWAVSRSCHGGSIQRNHLDHEPAHCENEKGMRPEPRQRAYAIRRLQRLAELRASQMTFFDAV